MLSRIQKRKRVLGVRGRFVFTSGTGEFSTLTPGSGEVSREKSRIFAPLFALIGLLDILIHGSPSSMFRSSWIILRGWAGGTPVHVTQTKVFELPGADSRLPAAGEGWRFRRSTVDHYSEVQPNFSIA